MSNNTVRKVMRLLAVCALVLTPGILRAGEQFDGKWLTTITCPAKGNTEGYKIQLPSVVNGSNFRGEHGTAGEPGYLLRARATKAWALLGVPARLRL